MSGRTGNSRYRRNRQKVLEDNDVCHICGEPGADQVDHVIPWSKGGSDEVDNLRPCHADCNKSRGNKDYEQTVTVAMTGGYRF